MSIHCMDYEGGDHLNGRLALRVAVTALVKVRVCGLGLLWPSLYLYLYIRYNIKCQKK